MIKTVINTSVLLCLAALFLILITLTNQTTSAFRLDLTENRIYSLSEESKQMLGQLREPIYLDYYFSDSASAGLTSLRSYAERVESLLEEYAVQSRGKVVLQKIDPERFSEQEESAEALGLIAAPIGIREESVYFGLAGRNLLDDLQVIGFFESGQERFVEYQISKLIYQLSQPEPIKLSILTDLPVQQALAQNDSVAMPSNEVFKLLEQLFEVQYIDSRSSSLPIDTRVLMLIDPLPLSSSMAYAVDQYVMKGGKALILVDPLNETHSMLAQTENHPIDQLLLAWGVVFSRQNIVLDATSGIEVQSLQGVQRHLGYLGIPKQQINQQMMLTSQIEAINGASFGYFAAAKTSQFDWQPILSSSVNSDLISVNDYRAIQGIDELSHAFSDQHQVKVLAARVSGLIHSAYQQAPEGVDSVTFQAAGNNANVIVVADTDLLADHFWAAQEGIFGQAVLRPFANNADFVINVIENLGGSDALIGIRGRGNAVRPFSRVEALTLQAEKDLRRQKVALQNEIEEIEAQLIALQSAPMSNGALLMSSEQEKIIRGYLSKQKALRKALRDVHHQLNNDIETLGILIKTLNIAVAPLILMFLLYGLVRLTRRRARER